MRVIPAVLADNLEEFKRLIEKVKSFTSYMQIDLMDGQFVPSKSISVEDLGSVRTNLRSESHLMVKNPESYLSALKEFGSEKIVFHYEAVEEPGKLIKKLRGMGFKVGIAINPETPCSFIEGLVDLVDSVLLLTVDPGFYGHKFIPEVLEKVKELKSKRPDVLIGVDGGIKKDNIEMVLDAGVDFVCVGSGVLAQEDPRKSFNEMEEKFDSRHS